jgi:hypothetical protein
VPSKVLRASTKSKATPPATSKATDARRAERHRAIQFLWFHCLDGESGGLARTVDVSETGVGFITTQDVALRERVFVVLLTPFGRVSAIARVAHRSVLPEGTFRVGVQLEIVPPPDRVAWATLTSPADKETG